MSQPDVTVIMPTWNRAGYLPMAIASVAEQTADVRVEILIADDASTDDTAEVVRREAQRFLGTRLLVRYHPIPKGGVCVARNTALAATEAPVVAFLDSDDVWEPGKLEAQLSLLSDSVGVVHSDFRYIDSTGQFTDSGGQRPQNQAQGFCLKALLWEDTVVFSTVLARRSLVNDVARAEPHGLPFDPKWVCGEDYDLLLRLARVTEFAYVANPLVQYRIHPNQTGMNNLARVFNYHCRVQVDFAARHGSTVGLCESDGIRAASDFLYGRAESHYWQRKLTVVHSLCELAEELHISDDRYANLRRRANRPRWLLAMKDTWDTRIRNLR